MGRSRYKIYEPTHPHFVTCTIPNWLPVFTRKESVEILIQNLKLYAYVVLENHMHLIVQEDMLIKLFAGDTPVPEIMKE